MVTIPNPKMNSKRHEASHPEARQYEMADTSATSKLLAMEDEVVERLLNDLTEYAKRNSYDATSILAKFKEEGIEGKFVLDLYRFSNKNFAEMIENLASEVALNRFWDYAKHPEWQ